MREIYKTDETCLAGGFRFYLEAVKHRYAKIQLLPKRNWQLLWCLMNFSVSQWINSSQMSFKATSVPLGAITFSKCLSKIEIRQRYLKYQSLWPALRHLIKLISYMQKEYVVAKHFASFCLRSLGDNIKTNEKLTSGKAGSNKVQEVLCSLG